MVPKKAKSKRVTLKQKHKVEKKIRQHNKQQRREMKKNPQKPKKDPGIPNLHPFKEQMLKTMEAQKLRAEAEKERQKEQRRKLVEKKRKQSLNGMVQDAAKRTAEFDRKESMVEADGAEAWTDNSKRAYYREFKKVCEQADVILEVLDARDPLGCRCEAVEQMILGLGSDKRIVLVLNKIDLVPKDVVQQWLKYLRSSFPTVAFKSSTQEQKKNLGASKATFEEATESILNSSESLGVETLIKLLKNYSRSGDVKKAIRVGIVGYPNVGKSSLINSLKRSRTCTTGAMPGVTKQAQEVHLDKSIKLLDSPGIVFSSDNSDSDIILRNCVNIDNLPDPVKPVEIILKRCNKDQLLELYELPDFDNVQEFLTHLAIKRGKLKKGGIADLEAAAHAVLQDWNSGAIPFYTLPPAAPTSANATVVSGFSQEFNIDELLREADTQALAALPNAPSGRFVQMSVGAANTMDMDMLAANEEEDAEFEDVEMDEDEEEGEEEAVAMEDVPPPQEAKTFRLTKTQINLKAKKEKAQASTKQEIMTVDEMVLNPQLNKGKKKAQKDMRKQAAKQVRKGEGVVPGAQPEAYDFSGAFASMGQSHVMLDD
eukprot:comp23774_c0_seq1/m.41213 comp23774_c0_seq1/g.41213  ORF comp23774_c0_seq1/g.41213 comp23774_c0_seq1/m.41213 type:complete len:598 (-) comp23774_c0_seq1:359-2152(-)